VTGQILSQIIQMKHELMKWERNVDKVWTHNVICINVCTFKICKCFTWRYESERSIWI